MRNLVFGLDFAYLTDYVADVVIALQEDKNGFPGAIKILKRRGDEKCGNCGQYDRLHWSAYFKKWICSSCTVFGDL